MHHPDNAGGLSLESEVAASGNTSNGHYLSASGHAFGVQVSSGGLPALAATQADSPVLANPALVKAEFHISPCRRSACQFLHAKNKSKGDS